MNLTERQNRLVTGFLLVSLLVHLLLLLIPESALLPPTSVPEPVYVEVRPPEVRERELDLPVRPELEQPRETPAKRLGPADQVVEQERAPEGQDTEDRPRPQEPVAQPAPPRPEPQAPAPPAEPQPAPEPVEPAEPQPPQTAAREAPASKDADAPRRSPPQPQPEQAAPAEAPSRPLPDLNQLTQISPTALAKIDSDWRQKYREDVLKGDTVWMDTEQDLLHSFMRRFRDNVYLVWNYPAAAAQRGQQGTLLLRVTVNRRGEVEEVRLLESSGYRLLDEEAIRAVKQGASYGPLPRAYPNEKLNIMAFFEYSGARPMTRRPGRLY